MTYGLILAAGFGSRLGYDLPKAMIPWSGALPSVRGRKAPAKVAARKGSAAAAPVAGRTAGKAGSAGKAGKGVRANGGSHAIVAGPGEPRIIDHQLANLARAGIEDVWVVVGFKGEMVRSHIEGRYPGVRFVDNPMYMDTNTAKSTLLGLKQVPPGGVVTLNGDVVFDGDIVGLITDKPDTTTLAVDPRVCADEEIKYRIREGRLQALSKQVHGEGEAVGVNYIAAQDRATYIRALEYVEMQAYFERALEMMLPFTHKPVRCVPIGERRAMEIDFPEDLAAARKLWA